MASPFEYSLGGENDCQINAGRGPGFIPISIAMAHLGMTVLAQPALPQNSSGVLGRPHAESESSGAEHYFGTVK